MTWHEYADQHRPDLFTPLEQLVDSMPHCVPPVHRASRLATLLDGWSTRAWCWLADRLIPSPSYTNLPSPPKVGVPVGRPVETELPTVSGPADTTLPEGSTTIDLTPAVNAQQKYFGKIYGQDPDCWIDPTHITGHRCTNRDGLPVLPGEPCEPSKVGREVFERFEKDHPQWAEQ